MRSRRGRWLALLGLVVTALVVIGIATGWSPSEGPRSADPDPVVRLDAPETPGSPNRWLGPSGIAQPGVDPPPDGPTPSRDPLSITGVVERAATGERVAGAEVTLRPWRDIPQLSVEDWGGGNRIICPPTEGVVLGARGALLPAVAMTHSDETGAFRFDVDGGAFVIVATQTIERAVSGRATGGEHWRMKLSRPLERMGRVVDPDGGVVAGVQVTALELPTNTPWRAVTDERGVFHLPQYVDDVWIFEHPDFAPMALATLGSGPVDLVTTPRHRGRVTRAGNPQSGAEVWNQTGRGYSGPDGRFDIPRGLCADPIVEARWRDHRAAAIIADDGDHPDLELERAATVTVVLRGSEPALLAQTRVTTSTGEAPTRRTSTTAVFEGLRPGLTFFEVNAPGVSRITPQIRAEAGESKELVVDVARAVDVEGVVLDAESSAPIAGITVIIRQASHITSSWKCPTNDDGRFVCRAVTPGKRTLAIDDVDHPKVERTFDVPGPPLTIRLARGARISGTIAWADTPPERWTVVVRDPKAGAPIRADLAPPDTRGLQVNPNTGVRVVQTGPASFQTGALAPGTYRLFAAGAGTSHGVGEATVVVGTDDVSCTISVPRALRISGKILDPQGQGVAAIITAERGIERHTATSTAQGTFVLDDLSPGTWPLIAQRENQESRLDVEAGQTGVVLALANHRFVKLCLEEPDGARPTAVTIFGEIHETTTACFRLRGPDGEGDFEVSTDAGHATIHVPAVGDLDLGRIRLEPHEHP